uniref:Uncharacterized protein n=1 Tax=Cannabis sativa TaxID=3483 RepID=A0A803PLM7_CANSA
MANVDHPNISSPVSDSLSSSITPGFVESLLVSDTPSMEDENVDVPADPEVECLGSVSIVPRSRSGDGVGISGQAIPSEGVTLAIPPLKKTKRKQPTLESSYLDLKSSFLSVLTQSELDSLVSSRGFLSGGEVRLPKLHERADSPKSSGYVYIPIGLIVLGDKAGVRWEVSDVVHFYSLMESLIEFVSDDPNAPFINRSWEAPGIFVAPFLPPTTWTVIRDIFTEKVCKVTSLDPKFRSIKFLLSNDALIESSVGPIELGISLGIHTPYHSYFIWPDFIKCALKHLKQTPEPVLIDFSEDHSHLAETYPRHLPKMRLCEMTIEEIEAQTAARRKRLMAKSPKHKGKGKKSKTTGLEVANQSDLRMSSQHDSPTNDAIGTLLNVPPEITSDVGDARGASGGLVPMEIPNPEKVSHLENLSAIDLGQSLGSLSSSPAQTSSLPLGGQAEWDEISAFRIQKDVPFEESAENYFKSPLEAVKKHDDDFYISKGRDSILMDTAISGIKTALRCAHAMKFALQTDREKESLVKGYSRYKKNYEIVNVAMKDALSKGLSDKVVSLEANLSGMNLEKDVLTQERNTLLYATETAKSEISSLNDKLSEAEKATDQAKKALVDEKSSLSKDIKVLTKQVKKAFLSGSYQSAFKLYFEFKEGKSTSWDLDGFSMRYAEFKRDQDLVDTSSDSDEASEDDDADGA